MFNVAFSGVPVEAANPHILNISPPLNMQAKWFAGNVAYTSGEIRHEYVCAGDGQEFRERKVAVNIAGHGRESPPPPCKNLLGEPTR